MPVVSPMTVADSPNLQSNQGAYERWRLPESITSRLCLLPQSLQPFPASLSHVSPRGGPSGSNVMSTASPNPKVGITMSERALAKEDRNRRSRVERAKKRLDEGKLPRGATLHGRTLVLKDGSRIDVSEENVSKLSSVSTNFNVFAHFLTCSDIRITGPQMDRSLSSSQVSE